MSRQRKRLRAAGAGTTLKLVPARLGRFECEETDADGDGAVPAKLNKEPAE
jgi:hypothetical protein